MKNRYPILDNMQVLGPLKVIMPKGGTLPQHAIVLTQREFEFIRDLERWGQDEKVNLNKNYYEPGEAE